MRISISYVDRAPQTKASARTGCCGLSPAEPALLPVRRHVLGVELGAGLLDAALHRARLLPHLRVGHLRADTEVGHAEHLRVAALPVHLHHVLAALEGAAVVEHLVVLVGLELLRLAVVETGDAAEARLLPALSPAELAAEAPAAAHEVLVVPAAAALHVRHVLERDLAALDLGGVDRHEVARLARLVRLLPRGHRARPEAARAADAEVLLRLRGLLLLFHRLPLRRRHAVGHVRAQRGARAGAVGGAKAAAPIARVTITARRVIVMIGMAQA